jgi:hypothetical protein
MSKKIVMLNVALLALFALGAFKLRADWRAFDPAHDIARIQPAPQTFPPLAASVAAAPQAGDWTDIPSHNMFSFDRTDIDIAQVVEAAPPPPPKPSGPKPVLFGTLIVGSQKTAYVGSAGSKNSKSMKAGDEIDTWKIIDIQANSIAVESNGVRETVKINDPVTQIARDASKTALAGATQTMIQTNQPPQNAPQAASTTSVLTNTPPAQVLSGIANTAPAPIELRPGTERVMTLFGGVAVPKGAGQ